MFSASLYYFQASSIRFLSLSRFPGASSRKRASEVGDKGVKRNRANHDANKEGRFRIGITTDLEQPLSGVLNTALRCARLV